MNRPKAATRRAALAAFLPFAAALLAVSPAEASRTTTDARSNLAPSPSLALVEPTASVEPAPRFGFAADLGLLDPEAGPGGFVVFAAEAAQCELTYARNNPLKYVDPDGRLDQVAYDYYLARSTTEKAAGEAGVRAFDNGLVLGLGIGVGGYFAAGVAATAGPAALSYLLTPQGNQMAQEAIGGLALPGPSSLPTARGFSNAGEVLDFIKPGGSYLGKALSGSTIRRMEGGLEAAEQFYGKLSAAGEAITKEGFKGKMAKLADGTVISIRAESKSGPPTVGVMLPDGSREIKFKFIPN